MSEKNNIIFKYKNQEKKVPLFSTYEECLSSFKKIFKLKEDNPNFVIFYLDEDNDRINIESESDYKLFLDMETKTIEGENGESEEIIIIESDNIDKIEKLKKEREDLAKKHEEEIKQKEEENDKKYKEALKEIVIIEEKNENENEIKINEE